MTGLHARAHGFAPPPLRDEIARFYTEVLGAEPVPLPHPALLVFRFPSGGSYSIELTESALPGEQARHGAWLELGTDDPDALARRVLEAGARRIDYLTGRFYFQAPGGQVWGVAPAGG